MLKDRQKSVLGAVIEAYVRTARPVASRELAQEFDFGLSSATLRNELLRLDELGYVEQPHPSAGRVPTDRGYRFFVDYLLTDAALTVPEKKEIGEAFDMREEDEFVRELSRAVAHISGMFTAAGSADDGIFYCQASEGNESQCIDRDSFPRQQRQQRLNAARRDMQPVSKTNSDSGSGFVLRNFYKTGLATILEEPEFEDQERVRAFAHLADALDEEIKNFLPLSCRGATDEARIFIGRENPWKEARNCAMAISFWEHPSGFRGFVSMIGPTRADYRKQKAIFEEISHGYE